MPKKKTKEEFVEEAVKRHGKKYDYSKVVYENSIKKVIIICPIHGEFLKAPNMHLSGQGCRKCSGKIPLTQDSFVERSVEKHQGKYDYSQTVVKSRKDKVQIICKQHGAFDQLPLNHLKGQGCPECAKTSRKLTQRYSKEEYLASVRKKHGDKYDYSKLIYVNSQTKVQIVCPIHGIFSMKANSHANGQGCPKCGREEAKSKVTLDYSEFLIRAERTHENLYQYSEESYKNYTSKIKIFCSEHGFFEQTPHAHISMRSGCPECGSIKRAQSNQKGWETVLEMFKTVHGNQYVYDQQSYIDVTHEMRIKCPKHGWYYQKPYLHYGGSRCHKCAVDDVHEQQKIDFVDFKARAKRMHGKRYKYIQDDFIDIFTPIRITCSKHGEFLQNPRDHYRGSGCPKCSSSRGENTIRIILEDLNVEFEEQKTFKDLKHKSKLRCDFYLTKKDTVIEYNGIQHYEPVSVFGGLDGLEYTQQRDLIKYEYLNSAKIKLIIVRYDNDDVKGYLKEKLKIACDTF